MRIELTEATWFEEHVLSFGELCEISGLTPVLLQELIDSGAIAPLDPSGADPQYGASALLAARQARRLREDFELEAPGLLLVLGLLDRLGDLQGRLRELQARLPRHLGR